jgi:hypothetical protein
MSRSRLPWLGVLSLFHAHSRRAKVVPAPAARRNPRVAAYRVTIGYRIYSNTVTGGFRAVASGQLAVRYTVMIRESVRTGAAGPCAIAGRLHS